MEGGVKWSLVKKHPHRMSVQQNALNTDVVRVTLTLFARMVYIREEAIPTNT